MSAEVVSLLALAAVFAIAIGMSVNMGLRAKPHAKGQCGGAGHGCRANGHPMALSR
jgi:hypothetical protein